MDFTQYKVEFSRSDILSDPKNLISEDFKVSPELKPRVNFWFDIYTKYDDQKYVIHHAKYPWVVFEVVDLSPIYKLKKHKWTKYHLAKKKAQSRLKKYKRAFKRLRYKKRKFSRFEKRILNTLKQLPGSKKKRLYEARKHIRYQIGQKNFFESALSQFPLYKNRMQTIFENHNLPKELIHIPFVESSFNIRAYSKVGASGIWQIMPYTGKKYLKINRFIDERSSPFKSTLAAAKILQFNYKYLNQWPLAVTAYNHGPGGVKKALKRSGTTNIEDLLKKYYGGAFKTASANFYSCFLAALYAQNYSTYLFKNIDYEIASPLKTLTLKKRTRIKNLARQLKLTKSQLIKWNYDLRRARYKNFYLPKNFVVYLPANINTPKEWKVARLDSNNKSSDD